MHGRRRFLRDSLLGGVCLSVLRPLKAAGAGGGCRLEPPEPYGLTRDVPARLFDGRRCWAHPVAGIVEGAGRGGRPRVVMVMHTLELAGSDVFKETHVLSTDNLGATWSAPRESRPLGPRTELIAGRACPVAASGLWPGWHGPTRTLLGTGHTVVYTPEWRVADSRPRHTAYATYDAAAGEWADWRKLEMPEDAKFQNAGAGSAQRYDLADGTILLPIYFIPSGRNSRVTVLRCSFDGTTLRYESHGTELSIDNATRGLHEPSLTCFGGTYYLTIRNDERGYVTRSRDGQQFERLRPWTFDDGKDLGNYNTQQHWVTHSDGLYLVYTRRGANNDHVFRHRAPLFMARVDPERLCVLRHTERILVPERGARLGNFGVTDVSPEETWVTVAEWMQPAGVERYGSDGSVYVARLHWAKPNGLFRR